MHARGRQQHAAHLVAAYVVLCEHLLCGIAVPDLLKVFRGILACVGEDDVEATWCRQQHSSAQLGRIVLVSMVLT